jgi:multicomponent Na+:H+ antiporter subunit E
MTRRLPGNDADAPPRPSRPPAGGRVGTTVALFVLLSLFWLLLSGRIGLQYAIFMLSTVGLVLYMNPERPFARTDPSRDRGISGLLMGAAYLVRYLGWLLWNVATANVDVARRILDPRLPIRPQLFVFRTQLQDEVARVLVANSITLTPGTVTIDLDGDSYLVHAIHPETADAATSGALQNVVGPIFGEAPELPPEVHWAFSYRELVLDGQVRAPRGFPGLEADRAHPVDPGAGTGGAS